ncbi:MAG: TlpA disulfide reductase family protein [Chromatiaceae bacterium]
MSLAATLAGCMALLSTLSLPAFAGELVRILNAPPAPALEAADLAGQRRALSEYRGSVVLVNFWASWCPPCLREMPSLGRLAESLAERPFKVLAVNVGETPQRAAEAMRRIGYKGTLLLDPDQEIFDAWGARVLPSSFLVGCDGRLRSQAPGPLEWDAPRVLDAVESLVREGLADCKP